MGSVRYKVENDVVKEIHKVVVHKFNLSDVDDPDIYAAGPIMDWQMSPAGQFVMAHAVEKPYWIRQADYQSYGIQYKIIARLSEPNQTFFKLKFK